MSVQEVNLGIRAHDVTNVSSLTQLREKLATLGIYNIQLALPKTFPDLPTNGENLSQGFGTFVKRELDKSGIQVAVLGCYVNIIHPDEAVRSENLARFKSYLRHAKSFGTSIVGTETGSVKTEYYETKDNFTQEAFDQVVVSVKELVQTAEKTDTMIGIEPGLNHPIYSNESILRLLEAIDSDNIGVIYDVTNMIHSENAHQHVEMFEEAYRLFGEKIVAVHLKDFVIEDGVRKNVAVGKGMMDVSRILEIIQQYKPYQYVILEETLDTEFDPNLF